MTLSFLYLAFMRNFQPFRLRKDHETGLAVEVVMLRTSP